MTTEATTEPKERKKKKGKSLLAICLAALILLSTIVWAFATSAGSVNIKRITILGPEAKPISFIMYVPKTATADSPAPTVLNFSGRASNGHSLAPACIEQSRRGYVAITVDIGGGGESEYYPGFDEYVIGVMDYILDLDFVDSSQISLLGNSAGCWYAIAGASLYPDNVVSALLTVHPKPNFEEVEDLSCNILFVKAEADLYNYKHVDGGTSEAYAERMSEIFGVDNAEKGTVYGSYEDGTARQFVIAQGAIHHSAQVDKTVISSCLTFLNSTMPAPNWIDANNFMYVYQQIFSALCYITFIIFIMAIGITVLRHPAFDGLTSPMPENKGLRKAKLARSIFISVLFPMITFVPISYCGMVLFQNSSIIRSRNYAGVLVWMLFHALFSACTYIYDAYKRKKNGEIVSASDYGLAAIGQSKINWKKVARAFVAAAITVITAYVWLAIVENYFGVNYQVWVAALLSKIPVYRTIYAIPAIIVCVLSLLVSSIDANVKRRLPETGNAKKDMVKAILINGMIGCAPTFLLLVIQYGVCLIVGTGFTPIPTFGISDSAGSLDFATGLPIIMFAMTSINTYFYRKTGTIWVGALTAGIFAGFAGTILFNFTC